MTIYTKFGISDWVYHKASNVVGIITKICVEPESRVTYFVQWNEKTSGWHYEIELSEQEYEIQRPAERFPGFVPKNGTN